MNREGIIHMTKFNAFALAAVLSMGAAGVAHANAADVSGAWKFTAGSNAACTLTLTSDADNGGTVASQDCASGLNGVSRWKTVGPRLQLLTSSGDLIAYASPKGDTYEGTRITDQKKIVLSR
jgi:hypothetical protein